MFYLFSSDFRHLPEFNLKNLSPHRSTHTDISALLVLFLRDCPLLNFTQAKKAVSESMFLCVP